MDSSIKENRMPYLLGFFFTFVVISILLLSSLLQRQHQLSGLFFLFQYLFFLAYLLKNGDGFASPIFLISLLLLTSHAGYPILSLTGSATLKGFDMSGYTNVTNYFNSFIYVSVFLDFFYFGVFSFDLLFNQDKKEQKHFSGDLFFEEKMLQIIGLIFVAICIGPYFYVRFKRIVLFFEGGYLNTFSLEARGFIYTLSDMMLIGIICSIMGFRKHKVFVFVSCGIFILLELINILTGNRGMSVISILVMLMVLLRMAKLKRKTKVWLSVAAVIVGYLALTLLSAVGTVRNQGFNIQNFVSVFGKKLLSGEGIISLLGEFSVNISSVFLSIATFPTIAPYSYGTNYLSSLEMIFPNFFGNLTEVMNKNTFIYYFPDHSSRGGSIIGESFYAFGPYGVVVGLIFGLASQFLSINFLKNFKLKKYSSCMAFFIPVGAMMWWIRDYFYGGIRLVVWSESLLFLLKFFYCRIIRKKVYRGPGYAKIQI